MSRKPAPEYLVGKPLRGGARKVIRSDNKYLDHFTIEYRAKTFDQAEVWLFNRTPENRRQARAKARAKARAEQTTSRMLAKARRCARAFVAWCRKNDLL